MGWQKFCLKKKVGVNRKSTPKKKSKTRTNESSEKSDPNPVEKSDRMGFSSFYKVLRKKKKINNWNTRVTIWVGVRPQKPARPSQPPRDAFFPQLDTHTKIIINK